MEKPTINIQTYKDLFGKFDILLTVTTKENREEKYKNFVQGLCFRLLNDFFKNHDPSLESLEETLTTTPKLELTPEEKETLIHSQAIGKYIQEVLTAIEKLNKSNKETSIQQSEPTPPQHPNVIPLFPKK